jgi:hypothetical protein
MAPVMSPTFDRGTLERRLHVKLADWRGLLTRNVATGNAMLRTLLAEPIRFTPVLEDRRRGYRFEGRIALDWMLTGLVALPELSARLHQLVSSPEGTADGWPVPLRGSTTVRRPESTADVARGGAVAACERSLGATVVSPPARASPCRGAPGIRARERVKTRSGH